MARTGAVGRLPGGSLRVALAVVVSVLAGVLVAGLMLPLVGTAGSWRATRARTSRTSPACSVSRCCRSRPRSSPPTARCSRPSTRRTAWWSRSAQISPLLQQADRRHRGQPVLRPQRRRPARAGPRARQQRPGRLGAGRLDPDPAVRQERPDPHRGQRRRARRRHRADAGAQAARDAPGPRPGEGLDQAADPRGLPQHRLLRRRGVRRRGRVAALLRRPRLEAHPPAGGDPRGHRAVAGVVRPAHQPEAVRSAGATSCCTG